MRDRRGPVVLRLGSCDGWQPSELGRRFKRAFGRELSVDTGAASPAGDRGR
jgi:hypothetical protein